jgi:hypothetical protein
VNQTHATQYADLLDAVSSHLRTHPELPVVYPGSDGDLHIAPHYRDSRTSEQHLIAWADTMPGSTITALRYHSNIVKGIGDDVRITIHGTVGGVDVQVWQAINASFVLGLEHNQERDLTIDELRALAAPTDASRADDPGVYEDQAVRAAIREVTSRG